jgi:ferric-dicitrate binding protein FerR (iron transport regulator)
MSANGQHIDFELIARHLSGEGSPTEEQQLQAWIESSEENRKLFEEYRSLWEKMDRVRPVTDLDIDAEWEHLESLIEKASVPQSTRVIDIGRAEQRPSFFLARRLAIAAVVIIMLGLGGIYTSRNLGYRTVATSTDTEDIILPDGSSVTLNMYSSLKYPKRFKKDERVVYLEGEGYFEVKGNAGWPFSIQTELIYIRVLGTSFNVNAYKSNEEVEVIVKSGEVAVTRHGEVPKTVILKPGNKAIYYKTREDLVFSAEIDRNYLSWKTKNFIFEDATLREVAESLNKVYGSVITIPSDSLKNARITTSFRDQSLDAILNVLSATLDLEVRELNGSILLEESN